MNSDNTKVGDYSRAVYGDVADLAEKALIDVVDNGNARFIDDDLRHIVLHAVRIAYEGVMAEPKGIDASLVAASEHTAKRVLAHQEVIATRLRELAEIVERRKPSTSRMSQGMTYIGLAEDITHDIKWGVSNLPIDLLTRAAAEADIYAAQAGAR